MYVLPYSWAKKTQGQQRRQAAHLKESAKQLLFRSGQWSTVTVLVPRQTEVSISVWGKPSELGNSLLSTNQRPFIYTGPQALSRRPSTIRSRVGPGSRLRKFNRAREIEFNFFLPLGLSLWNLAHLFIMFMATKNCLRFFNFCLGT